MYKVIKNYCENGSNNGLYLIDMPTGSGKTYCVLQYIFEACQKEENKDRKYIFVTPLKKNLPDKELKKIFADNGKEQEFDKKVLKIDKNSEFALNNYSDEMKKNITEIIPNSQEFIDFEQEVNLIKTLRKNESPQQSLKYVEENFWKTTERKFRKVIQKKLEESFSTPEARIKEITVNKKWQWVGKLYPTVFTSERQILFMTIDKFILKNSPIVEPSYYFFNSSIIDNSIIFIDEFDSNKEKILDKIIEDGLNGKIDSVELFNKIYHGLPKSKSFPTELTETDSFKNIIKELSEKSENIYKRYNMQFHYRTEEEIENSVKNFLFQDYTFHSVLSEREKYITSFSDKKKHQNIITYVQEDQQQDKNVQEDQQQDKNYNISSMLGEIRGFIKLFQYKVITLANNYKEKKDKLTQEESFRSILDLFHLKQDEINYLITQIQLINNKSKKSKKDELDDNIYEKGFRYYCFENSPEHNMRTGILMNSYDHSPEKMLVELCERAKVIGISATATIPTVIGNFDLEYIKPKLENYSELSANEEEYKRLSSEFTESQHGYDIIKIHAELIGNDNYSLKTWLDIVNNNVEKANTIYHNFENYKVTEFNCKRYARIATAFKEFLTHDIQSMLCLLMKFPKENDPDLNKTQLFDILSDIAEVYNYDKEVKNYVIILKSDNYDIDKEKISKRLSKNEKLFIISTYKTIGCGQNLQYEIPKEIKDSLIKSDNYSPRKEKDFDAIYLDKPRNLLVNLNLSDNLQEKDLVKCIFQMEFLQENAEISRIDARNNIKNAFNCFATGKKNLRRSNFKDTLDSIRRYATMIIIQAIGRICRTNQKKSDIYVFADKEIAGCIDLSITEKKILNREFIALRDKIKDISKEPELDCSLKKLENKADDNSEKSYHYIRHMLDHSWTNDSMKKWSELRQFVLTHPTVSQEEMKNNYFSRNYYIELPEKNNILYYFQERDYNNVTIAFKKTEDKKNVLNAENTRLLRLMKWQPLQAYFVSNKFATDFQKNDYILTPPLWNNVYKGALGEVVGKFWFKEILGIELEELTEPEKFEKFDFRFKNIYLKNIYVDFKNWDEYILQDPAEVKKQIAHIIEKAKKIQCKFIIIANVLTKEEYQIDKVDQDNIRVLSIPSLLNDSSYIDINQKALESIRSYIDGCTD